jgi:hypothetical protein
VPKYQEAARTVLEQGHFIIMRCSKCGTEFEYDRGKGEVPAAGPDDLVIDMGDMMMVERWNADGLAARHEGRPAEAFQLHERALQVYLKMRDTRGVIQTKGHMALALEASGDRPNALALLRECEASARQLGDDEALQAILGNQAAMLADDGDIASAAELLGQQAALCSRVGNTKALGQVLLNQGILHVRGLNDARTGMAVLAQGVRQCRANGMGALAAQALPILHEAARMILEPALSGTRPDLPADATTQAQLIQGHALELRDQGLFELATLALTRVPLLSGDTAAAMRAVDQAHTVCRQAGWTEPEASLRTLNEKLARFLATG